MGIDDAEVIILEDFVLHKDIINGFQKIGEIASPVGIPIKATHDLYRLVNRLGWLIPKKPSCLSFEFLILIALYDHRRFGLWVSDYLLVILLGLRIQGNHGFI
jgi:hypothetical protein